MDGPEGLSEHGAYDQSEGDETGAAYADSAESSSEGKASNYKQQDTVMGEYDPSTGSLSKSSRTILALNPSPFGSPFAYASYQNKHDFFKGLLVENTRVLFDQVVADAPRLRDRLMQRDDSTNDGNLTNDGSRAHLCVLDLEFDSSKESNNRTLDVYSFTSRKAELRIPLFADPNSIAHSRTDVARGDLVDPDKGFDVCRHRNLETGEFEYFVENEHSVYLSINGIRVDSSVRAGPLPPFAVFELQDFSVFWWRMVTALEYMPVSRLKRKSEDNDEDEVETEKRSSKNLRKNENSSSGKSFEEHTRRLALAKYTRRLVECEGRPHGEQLKITQTHPSHQLPANANLTDDDVALAIAAVWHGLILEDSRFAFGDTHLFQIAQHKRMYGYRAVCELQPFVIPLMWSENTWKLTPETEDNVEEDPDPSLPFPAFWRNEERENQENIETANQAKAKDPGNKDNPVGSVEVQQAQRLNFEGGIGHFVLTTAEICLDGRVQITIRDSLPLGEMFKSRIRRAARNVVRFSGWLGDEWPQFAPEVWQSVTKQSCGNTCAYHTILNAWAYMLKLPLAIRKEPYTPSFYRHAKRLMWCALRGQLDGPTISAFLQITGYWQSPILVESQQDVLHRMRSVAMNEQVLTEIIDQMVREMELEYERVVRSVPPKSWEGRLKRYSARWKKLRLSKPRNIPKAPTQISSVSGMAPEDVVIAIASIWEALNRNTAESKRTGQAVKYAYAGCDILAPSGPGEFEVTGVGVVGRRKEFIIPIMNQSTKHFFLAIAMVAPGLDKKQKSGPCQVTLCIVDSRPNTISRYEMWAQCMSLIHSSGWLGGREIRPHCDLAAVNFMPVPHQEGIDACGFYVILNAWAHMLEIITHGEVNRRGSTTGDDFLSQGLRIVNLALAGHMDSRTIQAFMNTHGYSTEQDVNNPAWAVTDVNAVGLNHEKFERVLSKRHDDETLQDAAAAGARFLKTSYAACSDQEEGMDRDEAWKALVRNDGDVQRAVTWWRASRSLSPSLALSPRTPPQPSRSD